MLSIYIKRYPLSLILLLVVVLLSVCPIGAPELARDVPLADKWVHMLMYAVLALVFCWETVHSRTASSPTWGVLALCILLPALLGGVLEFVQAYLTTYRSGELLDFVADSIGAAAGALICWSILRVRELRAKKQ